MPLKKLYSYNDKALVEPDFDQKWYLEQNPDVEKIGMDPHKHYLQYGKAEGRHPIFDSVWYLQRYPDVASSGIDPLKHYLDYGKVEGRYPCYSSFNSDDNNYPKWVVDYDTITVEIRSMMQAQCKLLTNTPLISVVMPVYNPNPVWLVEAIESVRKQIYPNWELCIADDLSSDLVIRPILESYSKKDKRIKVIFRTENGHISKATNSALKATEGEWIALLDHDDVLPENALFWVVNAINKHPECRLIYSDEDKINEQGYRFGPYFKCAWNPDLFYSHNMFSHLGVYHAKLIRKVKGFRIGLEGSQDYDLALRCSEHITSEQIHHIPRVLYHWRAHAGSTASSLDAKPYAMIAGERALNEHFDRQGINAKAELLGYGYRVRYALPKHLPLVSLIIPTCNSLKLLKQCIESILAKTTYSNYEILIVDNGSDELATLRYLKFLARNLRIRVLRDDRPFNYSALNNAAVKEARGEIIGLINNDIEVISPDWLSEMVSHTLRPEVGAVGARLWYANDTLQHAGVVLGVNGIAGHAHRFLPRDHVGYCGRASLIQSFSAVTGACLVVRKSLYEQIGGLNEIELQMAGNDIDFCLRLREAGYRTIWTPYAELYNHKSATRGFDDTPEKLASSAREIAYMQKYWGELLHNDPAYSPNLSLDNEDFSLAWPPRIVAICPDLLKNAADSYLKEKLNLTIKENVMPKRVLFIHVGGGKTGSSALQNFFELNWIKLDSYGFTYENRVNIKSNYDMTSGNGFLLYEALHSAVITENEIDNLITSYFGLYNKAICSSEFLAILSEAEWIRLLESSKRLAIKIKVIFYVRNAVPFFVSVYDQMIKRHGESRPFEECVAEYNWDHIICLRTISNVIPKEDIHVRHYESIKENLISDFLNVIGVENLLTTHENAQNRIVNRSLTNKERQVMCAVNRIFADNYSSELSDLLIYSNPDVKGEPVLYNSSTIKYLQDKWDNEASWVNKNFFNELGNVSVLPSESVRGARIKKPKFNLAHNNHVEKLVFEWAINKIVTVKNESEQNILNALQNACQDTILPANFDPLVYLILNKDVLLAGQDPIKHYLYYGKDEGRSYTFD